MRITIGRGRNRRIHQMPAGVVFAKANPADAKIVIDNVVEMMRDRGIEFQS